MKALELGNGNKAATSIAKDEDVDYIVCFPSCSDTVIGALSLLMTPLSLSPFDLRSFQSLSSSPGHSISVGYRFLVADLSPPLLPFDEIASNSDFR